MMLPRSDVYEVAISCGYMLTMLALGAIWCALHDPERRWPVAGGGESGLRAGGGGATELVVRRGHPAGAGRRRRGAERRRIWLLLVAAIVPITLIGLGLMLYNDLRFDNPFEFGMHYQLARKQSAYEQVVQSALSLVQFPGLFSGAGALERSVSLRA